MTAARPIPSSPVVPYDQDAVPADPVVLKRALAWLASHGAEPLPWTRLTGETGASHGEGIDGILQAQGADLVTRLIGILACSQPLPREQELAQWLAPGLAAMIPGLLDNSSRLLALSLDPADDSLQAGRHQAETLRRMTMAMAKDVRVVMVRLASGVQTLRRLVADGQAGRAPAHAPTSEALTVLAPLANRLGLFRLKWEMEDLAFRCSRPDAYHALARQLESKRKERESFVAAVARELAALLQARGISASVSGRPKHLFSIHNKLQNKQLTLDQLHDLRAVRVLVETLADCYAALDVVHQRWEPEFGEFDDYIAKPKPNGYRSLHTVVLADDGRTLEVQIRTREMHEQAEYGVAAHWRYKERTMLPTAPGSGGGGKTGAVSKSDAGNPAASDQVGRLAWLRQLLAWQQDIGMRLSAEDVSTSDDSRIFVMTPQGRVIELPAGSTPVDFAYHVHSTLGHRCRGAKVDGRMVSLNTPLANGQVVEIIAVRGPGSGITEPGPSRDWLNPALGYLRSQRARAKVRQWFNVQQHDAELTTGRERVDKALAREGRTSLSLEELAARLGCVSTAALFADVARDVIGARALEEAIRALSPGAAAARAADSAAAVPLAEGQTRAGAGKSPGGNAVLVVGVDFLLTQLARCCHPAPPDLIVGYITRGKGVTVHRQGCGSIRQLALHAPERILPASWGEWDKPARIKRGEPVARRYPVAIQLHASDRPGLLRDITEVFARERMNVLSVRSNTRSDQARFNFIVEVLSAVALGRVLGIISDIPGVDACTRG